MAASFIGLDVALELHNGRSVTGRITQVDTERNILVLFASNREVSIDKGRIKAISVVSKEDNTSAASQSASSAPLGSSYSNGHAVPALGGTTSAPDAANLPVPQTKSKAKKNKKDPSKVKKDFSAGAASPSLASSSTAALDPVSDDFDFEASAKSFDKARIWNEIRKKDRSDPAALLVSHNRAATPLSEAQSAAGSPRIGHRGRDGNVAGEGKMRKLRNDESVLSPSPPPSMAAEPVEDPTPELPGNASHLSATTLPQPSSANSAALESENQILRQKLAIVEALSGISLSSTTAAATASSEQDQTFSCTVLPPALPSSSASPAAAPSSVSFTLTTTSATPLSGQQQVRFKPGEGVPDKYRREMGLRLDNGSARVFVERLRNAAAGT